MTTHSCIELKDLRLITRIGTYAPGDVVPDYHALDLTLWVSSDKVLIAEDGMSHVFDYDPLVVAIEKIAAEGHYQTQERLITRIVALCAGYPAVEALEIALRKFPVRAGSGSLGVRTRVEKAQLQGFRDLSGAAPQGVSQCPSQ